MIPGVMTTCGQTRAINVFYEPERTERGWLFRLAPVKDDVIVQKCKVGYDVVMEIDGVERIEGVITKVRYKIKSRRWIHVEVNIL